MEALHKSNQILYKTWGYDSVLRLIGYASKIIYWRLLQSKPKTAKKVKTIGDTISEYRVITRFSGLPDTIEGLLTHLSKQSSGSTRYNVELAQHLSMLLYYPFEHISWLRDNKILSGSSDATWRWSSQAWAVWVILEIFLQKENYEKADSKKKQSFVKWYAIKCLMDLILAYHWAVKKSVFSDHAIGWVGFVGTSISLYQKWKQ